MQKLVQFDDDTYDEERACSSATAPTTRREP
jgi:hypothetical protein